MATGFDGGWLKIGGSKPEPAYLRITPLMAVKYIPVLFFTNVIPKHTMAEVTAQ